MRIRALLAALVSAALIVPGVAIADDLGDPTSPLPVPRPVLPPPPPPTPPPTPQPSPATSPSPSPAPPTPVTATNRLACGDGAPQPPATTIECEFTAGSVSGNATASLDGAEIFTRYVPAGQTWIFPVTLPPAPATQATVVVRALMGTEEFYGNYTVVVPLIAPCTVTPPIPTMVETGRDYTAAFTNCGTNPYLHVTYADGFDEIVPAAGGTVRWAPLPRPGRATISIDKQPLGSTIVEAPPATRITLTAPAIIQWDPTINIPFTVTGNGTLTGNARIIATVAGESEQIATATLSGDSAQWSSTGIVDWTFSADPPDADQSIPLTLTVTLGALNATTTSTVIGTTITGWQDTPAGTTLNVTVTDVFAGGGQTTCSVVPILNSKDQPAITAPLVNRQINFQWTPPQPGIATLRIDGCATSATVFPAITISGVAPAAAIVLNASPPAVYPYQRVELTARIANASFGTGPGQCEPINNVVQPFGGYSAPMDYTPGSDTATLWASAGLDQRFQTEWDIDVTCDFGDGTVVRSSPVDVQVLQPVQVPTAGVAGVPQTISVADYYCLNGVDTLKVEYASGFVQSVEVPITNGMGSATFTPVVGEITGITLVMECGPYDAPQQVSPRITFSVPPAVQDAEDDLVRERMAAEDAASDAERQARQATATSSLSDAQRDLQSALTDEQVARDALANAQAARQTIIDNRAAFTPDDYTQRLADADETIAAIKAAINRSTASVADIQQRIRELSPQPVSPQPVSPQPVSPQPGGAAGSTDSATPPPVTDLTATVSGTTVTLTWVGNPQASRYVIYLDGAQVRQVNAPATTTSLMVPAGPHRIEVRAANANGESTPVGVVVDGSSVQDLLPRAQVQILSSTNITFTKGSTTLTKRGHKQVKAIAKRYKRTARAGEDPAIVVHAYAGKDAGAPGTRIDDRRAHTIRQALIRAGVPADVIDVVGGGLNGDRSINKGRYANVLIYEA